jgi:hypothetical protein
MQLDLSHQITNIDGTPAVDETGQPAELKTVLSKALLAEPANPTPTSKLARFELYLKLKFSELKADITTEEATLLKEAASIYPVLVYGQIVHWIEGKVAKV